MGVKALQTPEKQVLPIAPAYPDLNNLTKWAGDLTRTLQQNLATIARKANDTATLNPTADINFNGHSLTNLLNLGNISGTITYKGADIDTRFVLKAGDTMTGNLVISNAGEAYVRAVSTATGHTAVFRMGGGGNTSVVFDSASNIGFLFMKDTTANIAAGSFGASTTLWTISTAGTVIQTGPLDLTNAAAGQIAFPATQNPSSNANTLDDYEEGTWTPTISASVGTITTSSASGQYTKIGRSVLVNINITITTVGTGAGTLNASLPFTAGNGQWVLAGRENAVTGNMLQGYIAANATVVNILTYNNLTTIGAGDVIYISGSYDV